MAKSTSIILIHGNFVNNKTWTEWKRRYEQKGYTVYTPANPGHVRLPVLASVYDGHHIAMHKRGARLNRGRGRHGKVAF